MITPSKRILPPIKKNYAAHIPHILIPLGKFLRVNTYGRKFVTITYTLSSDIDRDVFIDALRKLGIIVFPLFYHSAYIVLTEAQRSFLIGEPIKNECSAFNRGIRAIDLARYILFKYRAKKPYEKAMSNLYLQKILYYVYGFYYATFHRPLFSAEIMAWKYGPSVPDVYYEFCTNGCLPIEVEEHGNVSCLSFTELCLIDSVCEHFTRFSARELVGMTLHEDPWRIATRDGAIIKEENSIPPELIYTYFKEHINDYHI